MLQELLNSNNASFRFEQPPIQENLVYLNSAITLSAMPKNYIFIEDPNPPTTITVRQNLVNISLDL